jgi:hypothetical protein
VGRILHPQLNAVERAHILLIGQYNGLKQREDGATLCERGYV